MDLNGIDIFLGHNWLVKHNLEVNQDKDTIQFTRYPRTCKTIHQDITFKIRKVQVIDIQNKRQQKIRKEPDPTNLKDLPEFI